MWERYLGKIDLSIAMCVFEICETMDGVIWMENMGTNIKLGLLIKWSKVKILLLKLLILKFALHQADS